MSTSSSYIWYLLIYSNKLICSQKKPTGPTGPTILTTYGCLKPSHKTVQDTVPSSKGKSSSPAKQSRALKVNSFEDSNKEPETNCPEVTPPKIKENGPLERGRGKRKGLSSKHYFFRNMFVVGGVIGPFRVLSWTKATWTVRDTEFCKLVHISLTYILPKKAKGTYLVDFSTRYGSSPQGTKLAVSGWLEICCDNPFFHHTKEQLTASSPTNTQQQQQQQQEEVSKGSLLKLSKNLAKCN